jgi:hypothetical protein
LKTNMKNPLKTLLVAASLGAVAPVPLHAQTTAFAYQGQLMNNGAPAKGVYDLQFAVHASKDGNGPQPVAGPLQKAAHAISNGLFTVTLDFGPGIFNGSERWLAIGVRTNGSGAFAELEPRQPMLAAPHAIFAASASNVVSGAAVKSLNTLKDNVTLAAGPNVTISSNGNTLTIAAAGAGGSGIWSTLNNNAYYNAGNVGLGTSTPAHRLSLSGGPSWTANYWIGGLSLDYATAIGWRANPAGQRFGMGHTTEGFFMFRTASDPGTTTSPAIYDFGINNSGNVGIGTTAPTSKLSIAGASDAVRISGNSPYITFFDTIPPVGQSRIQGHSGGLSLQTYNFIAGADPYGFLKLHANGKVGLGSHEPVGKLEIIGQDALRMIGYQPFLSLYDSDSGFSGVRIQNRAGEMVLEPQSFLSGSNPNAYAKLYNSGNFSVATLTIRGGADLAEPFEFSSEAVPAGSVVTIDEEHPGKLKLSTRAYDTRVAGIVSGAHGIQPGISLHQEGALEGGQNVALSGRVYVQADAAMGAISPGDLLTTSDTPGHAMRVSDPAKAQGAILGKAMSLLKEGKGMVLVLVSLQ